MAAPVQAKFIGIAIYDPKVMLPICKNEIAQGRAGVCTGYVIAISEGMRAYSAWVPHDSLCIPSGTEYEDMVQVVVSWTELSLRRNPEGARILGSSPKQHSAPLGAANSETLPRVSERVAKFRGALVVVFVDRVGGISLSF